MTRTPGRVRGRLGALGIAFTIVALAFVPSGVLAQTDGAPDEPVRVQLEGPSGCPDGARFFDELRARTRRARAATGDEPARLFRVTLSRDGAPSGTLVIDEPGHSTQPRTVRGASCEEVVGALALVAALAIDPHAAAPVAPTSRVAGDAGSDAPADDASRDALAAVVDASAPDREADSAAPPPSPDAGPELPTSAPEWRYTAGALFDVVGAAAPGAVVGASVFARVDRDPSALFGTTLRLGLAAYGDHAIAADAGAGRFTWWVGQLDACPLRLALGSDLRVEPCVALEVGAVVATGSGVTNDQSRARPWLSAGALGPVEWRVAGPVALEAYAGIRAPIVRETFVFDPSTFVYTPPPLVLVGGAGLGVSFP